MKLSDNLPEVAEGKYTGVKVSSLYRALLHSAIRKHLTLYQVDKVSTISNRYKVNGFIERADMLILWKYYVNFVIYDFRWNFKLKGQ